MISAKSSHKASFASMAVFCLLISSPAVADRTSWGEAGGWTIEVDLEGEPGCLMRKDFEDGLVVELGYENEREGAFFGAYHPGWQDIKVGQSGQVEFHFNETGFGGAVELQEKRHLKGGYVFFNNPEFVDEFARRTSVVVIGPEGNRIEISLKGTTQGLEALRKCQTEQAR